MPTLERTSAENLVANAVAPPREEVEKPPLTASSATAWLQTNIPSGTPSVHSNGIASPDKPLPTAAPPVGAPGGPTSAAALTPSLPPASLGRGSFMKPLVKLDAIVNGVLKNLGAMLASAKEPSTTNPLTSSQQCTIEKLIWSHESAMEELAALQNALDGGFSA